MSKKNAIAYIKPPEPAFLTAFKKKAGFKEGPSVDTKRGDLRLDDEQPELDDEKPTIVVLQDGDLSAQQAEAAIEHGAQVEEEGGKKVEDEEPPQDGRIRFKKPKKRKNDGEDHQSTGKKASTSKKVKNASLLSFNEDEDEV